MLDRGRKSRMSNVVENRVSPIARILRVSGIHFQNFRKFVIKDLFGRVAAVTKTAATVVSPMK